MESLATTLRQIPFFAGLPREDLARVVGTLEERPIAAGGAVFSQGEEGDGLYMVRSGAVEVVLERPGGPPQTLAVLGPHQCFGEMSLLTGAGAPPRCAPWWTAASSSSASRRGTTCSGSTPPSASTSAASSASA